MSATCTPPPTADLPNPSRSLSTTGARRTTWRRSSSGASARRALQTTRFTSTRCTLPLRWGRTAVALDTDTCSHAQSTTPRLRVAVQIDSATIDAEGFLNVHFHKHPTTGHAFHRDMKIRVRQGYGQAPRLHSWRRRASHTPTCSHANLTHAHVHMRMTDHVCQGQPSIKASKIPATYVRGVVRNFTVGARLQDGMK